MSRATQSVDHQFVECADSLARGVLDPCFDSAGSVISLASHLADSLTTPSQALARAELLAHLEEGLRALDPIDCEVLALRHFEELGNNETAEILGLTKAAAIELRGRGITCNAFSPWAKTRASYELDTYAEIASEEEMPFVFKRTNAAKDMTRITPTPDYIAPFICYLASEQGKDISGSIFSLGGNTISMYSEPEHERNMTKFGEGPWTMDELVQQVPRGLMNGYRCPADNPM